MKLQAVFKTIKNNKDLIAFPIVLALMLLIPSHKFLYSDTPDFVIQMMDNLAINTIVLMVIIISPMIWVILKENVNKILDDYKYFSEEIK